MDGHAFDINFNTDSLRKSEASCFYGAGIRRSTLKKRVMIDCIWYTSRRDEKYPCVLLFGVFTADIQSYTSFFTIIKYSPNSAPGQVECSPFIWLCSICYSVPRMTGWGATLERNKPTSVGAMPFTFRTLGCFG